MNKKSTRALASATVLSLVLTTVVTTANVKAAKGEITRLGGRTRYATAAQVAKENWKNGAENVILVSGNGIADALGASVLAEKMDAPIILTGSNELDAKAKEALDTLKPKNVIAIGGEGVLSKGLVSGLEKSYNVTRLGGQSRFDTNLKIANYLVEKQGVKADEVFVVNGGVGLADALTMAPVAASKGKILLIVGKDKANAENAIKFVKDHKSKVTVVGTDNMVTDEVYKLLGASKRVDGGHDRFATNLKILDAFKVAGEKLYVANGIGQDPIDALVASALAGKYNSPLVLTAGKDTSYTKNAINYIDKHANEKTDLNAVGGEIAVPNEVVEAINKAVKPEVKELAVQSIEAVNAKEMNVTFNKAIDKSTVLNEKNEVQNIDLTLLGETKESQEGVKGRLSEDGKVLTLVAKDSFKAGKYLVEGKDIEAKKVEKEEKTETIKPFNKIIEVKADTVRPTIVGTEKINAGKVKVKFSEPIKEVGTATFKYVDGTEVKGITGTLSAGNSEVEYVLGNDVEAGKDIVATFNGQKDFADNLIAPTPATVKFRKGEKDGVAPKVADIKVLSSTKFEVKFSEELIENPIIKVSGTEVAPENVKQDSKDKTKYVCTLGTAAKDLTKVTVDEYTDLSGEKGKEYSKLENFTIKTVAPKVVSTKYIKALDKVSKENKEYVEITFDKDVVSNDKLTKIVVKGNHVKDYVTTPVNKELNKADLIAVEGNKKALRIEAKKIADIEGAVYDLTLEGFEGDTISPLIKGDAASSDALKISFTRGIDEEVAQSKGEPKVVTDGVVVDNNDKITITFDKELDGKTATDASNYKIEKAVVEKATLRPAKDGKQNVELTIKSGSNTFNGDRYISISGVKAKGGDVMKDYKKVITLEENVRPTVKEAKLTDNNKLILTFSEDMKADSIVEDEKNIAVDFDVYVGDTKKEGTLTESKLDADKDNDKVKTITITIDDAHKFTAEEVKKGIVIKPAKGMNAIDSNGNALNFTSISLAK
ncbi:cell wall-binding repeat-containing protein [Clostridium oceanicum]|uniref:N-acetylmuramoyl-L-alanine amidase LytC n=1 Tax=Clostridium oceanicum TaxID=1543 RepID=A0ABP3UZY6_9CLOT